MAQKGLDANRFLSKKRPHFLALFYVSSSHAKMLSKEAPKVFLAVENSKKGRISFNKCWGV